jgi:hypothetical protein
VSAISHAAHSACCFGSVFTGPTDAWRGVTKCPLMAHVKWHPHSTATQYPGRLTMPALNNVQVP